MDQQWCVFKVSPSGVQNPLYYGSEQDCRKFCMDRDFEYIDEDGAAWYLEIGKDAGHTGGIT